MPPVTADIVLDYSPRRLLVPYHERTQRWAVIVAHRRFGKTVGTVLDLIKRAISLDTRSRPNAPGRYAYVAPFLSQGKEIAWDYLKRYSQPIAKGQNESELWVDLINGSRIRIHGADNPDRLRGGYLDGCVGDEYGDWRPSVFGEVIRPMLADYGGWFTAIGTPKGRNDFHALAERAKADPDWFHLELKASATGILGQDELDAAALDMTPEQYAQEFECSFDAAILGAYYGKDIAEAERAGRVTDVPLEHGRPVHTAWDIGYKDSTAIFWFQVVDGKVHVIDHYENHGFGAAHYAGVVAARGYSRGDDWFPHDARPHEWGSGRTRIETLKSLGLKPRVVPDHAVDDGINAGRLLWSHALVDQVRNADAIEALRQYRTEYDEKVKAFKKTPRHDWTSHTADAWRYMAMAWRELKPQPVKKKLINPDAYAVAKDGVIRSGATFGEIIKHLERKHRRNG